MHLLPFSIYVVCDDCARESLALFARHPEPERPASRSAQDSVKDAAVQPEVQPPHPESPDMAGADDAEERATGQRDRMDPLRELRRRRAETRASLDSVRQKFGDLDPGAGSA
ncbi:MAG: hypothetical protein O2923_10270 [Verrucomicrobia bacterium]|nr:hypothetical protein [Verrucomicrobiota bacterium]MDA1087652.1 hypothetical protein [Verrucomicrobiota bacterium]